MLWRNGSGRVCCSLGSKEDDSNMGEPADGPRLITEALS